MQRIKTLMLGIAAIVLIGIGGLVYRNAVEHPNRPMTCPLEAKVCPDGTSVGRTGSTCTFPACPPPNVELASLGISFALPVGFEAVTGDSRVPDTMALYRTQETIPGAFDYDDIDIQLLPISASSTASATIQENAIGGASGLPISPTRFTSTVIGRYRFTVVSIERFEGVITTAYYLSRATDVIRFTAIDRGVDWTNPSLIVSNLPAHAGLVKLLATLQGQQ